MKGYEYKTFKSKLDAGHATVYHETEQHAKLFMNKEARLDINWSCCGAVSIEEAESFLKALQEAITYAKNIRRKK